MTKRKKLFLGLAGGSIAILVFIVSLNLLLPWLINLESVKETILSEINRRFACEARFTSADISLLPRPHVIIHGGSLSLPGKVTGSLDSVTVYPKYLPLLTGEVKIDAVHLKSPRVTIDSDPLNPAGIAACPLSPATIEAIDFDVYVKDGEIGITNEGEPLFLFRDINGRMKSSRESLKVRLASRSNIWESLSLDGEIDPRTFASKAQLTLTRFRPESLAGHVLPHSEIRVGDSEMDMRLTFTGEGTEIFRGEFKASSPRLVFESDGKAFTLSGGSLEGGFSVDNGKVSVSLATLQLDQPMLTLTGFFLMDPSTPHFSLKLEGKDIDAAPVRDVALALAGRNKVVRKVFDVVRGGRVPSITFESEGASLRDIGKAENQVFRGNMSGGKIFVPKANIQVEGAQGDVVISGGILEGKNLNGRLGPSTGRNGVLLLGLIRDKNDDAPFRLDIELDADISQLPPILERVVKDDIFLRELGLMQDVKGRAAGRLFLGDRLNSVDTRVVTRDFAVSANYRRLPFPFDIKGGSFFYEGRTVAASGVGGMVGASSIAGVSVSLNWDNRLVMDLSSSQPARLWLNEVYPWVKSREGMKQTLKNFEAASGFLIVDALDFRGLVLDQRSWRFQAKGAAEDLIFKSQYFPGLVEIKSGRAEATQESLILADCRTKILDAALMVSGRSDRIPEGGASWDLTIEGDAGPRANDWITSLIDLPAEYRIRSPFSVSQGHLTIEKNGGRTAFAGDVAVKGGPRLSLDLSSTPAELSIRRMAVKDDTSNATLSLAKKKDEVDFGFQGSLNGTSLDKLLANNELLNGKIKGKFNAHIPVDRPVNTSVDGSLQVEGFRYMWKLKSPVVVETASFEAKGKRLDVRSAQLTVDGSKLNISGSVDSSAQGFQLNLDLGADTLKWDTLDRLLAEEKASNGEGEKPSNGSEQGRARQGSSIYGTVRVKADRFTYDSFTWSPLQASAELHRDGTNVVLTDAVLCGIYTLGKVNMSRTGTVEMDLKLGAGNQQLSPVLECFYNKKLMDGTFSVSGELKAKGRKGSLLESMQGSIDFQAREGRIYRFGAISKIFSLLNITEIYRGQLPDLASQGYAYDRISAKGKIENGKLAFSESTIDGPSMKMAWRGDVRLSDKQSDLTVVVAPLKTVDTIVKHVPLINGLLNGSLVSIPVGVSGDISDPSVTPLSPTAVGSELFGYVKRTLQLPLKLVQPLLPDTGEAAAPPPAADTDRLEPQEAVGKH